MKNLLIISEYFAPNNAIASIRVTKLAKYFKLNKNYHITVVSRKLSENEIIDPILYDDLKYADKHIVIDYSKAIYNILDIRKRLTKIKDDKINAEIFIESENKTVRNKIYSKFLSFIRNNINNYIGFRVLKNYVKSAVKNIKKNHKNFDVILSSYGPYSSYIIGTLLKKYEPKSIWIADFRDPVVFCCCISEKYDEYCLSYLKKTAKSADILTGVSDACTKYFEKQNKHKIYTICNGFDRDDIKDIKITTKDKFIMTYAGILYSGKRDLSIIFEVVRELIAENKIDKNNIIINYAGSDEIEFKNQIEKYSLIETVQFHGFIDRQQSLQLQFDSSMLLLASWNSIGETGVVTGKYLEYMMMNKPIVCTVTGNLPNSQLKEMITAANNGVVWEEANNESDYPLLKTYILDQYERFMRNEPLMFEPNMEYIEQYNYKNITQQFIDLIENNAKRK